MIAKMLRFEFALSKLFIRNEVLSTSNSWLIRIGQS